MCMCTHTFSLCIDSSFLLDSAPFLSLFESHFESHNLLLVLSEESVLRVFVDVGLVLDVLGTIGVPGYTHTCVNDKGVTHKEGS